MLERRKSTIINIDKELQNTGFTFVQGDKDVNIIVLTLCNSAGIIDLTGLTSTVTFKKKDGHSVVGTPTITDAVHGRIEYTLGTQEIAYPGQVVATVEIFDTDGARLTTCQFSFNVRAELGGDDAIQSTSEFPILTQLLTDTTEKESVRVLDENIRNVNELAREEAENIRELTIEDLSTQVSGIASRLNGLYFKVTNNVLQWSLDEVNWHSV